MTILYLDIETLPTSNPDVIAQFEKTIKAPATYKKPESIAEWMKENKESALKELVAKTSFSGLHGSIACISYAVDDGDVFVIGANDKTETQMLAGFFSHVIELTGLKIYNGVSQRDITVCGHNVAGFDLPFIKHRCIINKVPPVKFMAKAFEAKPWGAEVADTMLMWSSDREKRASMDSLCKAFGIAGKGDFDGSMVAGTWPTDPQKVMEYCQDDVRRTREMYKRITFSS